ncbi:MAG: WD40 repeat domain-containing protein [Saprospiraceae bacterium]
MKPKLIIHKQAQLTGHKAAIYALAPGKMPSHFFSAAGDNWVVEWDLSSPEQGKLIAQVETGIFSLCHLPKYQKMVAGNRLGGIHWIDLQKPTATKNIAHHQAGVFALLPLGEQVLSAGGEGMLSLWSIEAQRCLESFHLTNQHLRGIAYSPQRKELAVAASDHAIYFLDATDLRLKHKIEKAHDNSVFCLRYTPDEKYLVSGGRDAQLKIWSVADTFTLSKSIPAHMYTVNALSFHPDGQWLASGSRDKTIKIWDTANWELRSVVDVVKNGGHINSVNDLYWSTHENTLISASDDRSLMLWNIEAANNC